MFSRMVNPRRFLMVLASARKALNHQDHIIIRNSCPQIRQIRTLPQVFPPRNYCSVAEAEAEVQETNHVLSFLKDKEWCNETKEKLDGISDVSEDDVVSALKTLYPGNAPNFFEWYKKKPSYKPSSSVYNAMLRVLGREKITENFWKVAEEMKEHGFLMDEDTFVPVISRYNKRQMYEDSVRLFTWMAENPQWKPMAGICYRILCALSHQQCLNVDAAKTVTDVFKSRGGAMEKRVYDGYHRCLTAAGRFDEAEKVMEEMTKGGFAPDNITYSQLIYGLCRAKRSDEAREVLHEMKKRGCNPDIKTWTILIEGHTNTGETDRALALLSEMVASGCAADEYTIRGLLFHLCDKNREMDAYNLLLSSIEEQNMKPSAYTFREMIMRLAKAGMYTEANKISDLNTAHGYRVCGLGYVNIALSGTVDDACAYIEKIGKSSFVGKGCPPMLRAFISAGRKDDAIELFSRLPAEAKRKPSLLDIAKELGIEIPASEESMDKESAEVAPDKNDKKSAEVAPDKNDKKSAAVKNGKKSAAVKNGKKSAEDKNGKKSAEVAADKNSKKSEKPKSQESSSGGDKSQKGEGANKGKKSGRWRNKGSAKKGLSKDKPQPAEGLDQNKT